MTGVVIGTGAWTETARETAAAAERMTGVQFTVIESAWREVPHPSWLKLWVHEVVDSDSWLILDADTIPLKPWRPDEMLTTAGGGLMMARDRAIPAVDTECKARGLRSDYYLNGGLMLLDRKGATVLERARDWFPRCGPWLEQSAVNLACREFPDLVTALPRAFNLVCSAADVLANPDAFRHAATVHAVALGGDLAKFRQVRDSLLAQRQPAD